MSPLRGGALSFSPALLQGLIVDESLGEGTVGRVPGSSLFSISVAQKQVKPSPQISLRPCHAQTSLTGPHGGAKSVVLALPNAAAP